MTDGLTLIERTFFSIPAQEFLRSLRNESHLWRLTNDGFLVNYADELCIDLNPATRLARCSTPMHVFSMRNFERRRIYRVARQVADRKGHAPVGIVRSVLMRKGRAAS